MKVARPLESETCNFVSLFVEVSRVCAPLPPGSDGSKIYEARRGERRRFCGP